MADDPFASLPPDFVARLYATNPQRDQDGLTGEQAAAQEASFSAAVQEANLQAQLTLMATFCRASQEQAGVMLPPLEVAIMHRMLHDYAQMIMDVLPDHPFSAKLRASEERHD